MWISRKEFDRKTSLACAFGCLFSVNYDRNGSKGMRRAARHDVVDVVKLLLDHLNLEVCPGQMSKTSIRVRENEDGEAT